MCGIVGFISSHPQHNISLLDIARDTLIHRGPDSSGTWWSSDGRVGLAHRRLAIHDLSDLGHQPMHDHDRNLSLVFNGEIYNYKQLRNQLSNYGFHFRSSSDTEVLLASYAYWGTECVKYLNGMFSFAIFDGNNSNLFLARDRTGQKPLFYYLSDNSLYFASELKALFTLPQLSRRIDLHALDCYLSMGFVPGDRCIVDGFSKLPPAHALIFNITNCSCHSWRYWHLPSPDTNYINNDVDLLVQHLECTLSNAVSLQLASDVPVGILLSGGLDSSIIAALATRHRKNINTFSIGFKGPNNFDESHYAESVSQFLGTHHTNLVADQSSADLLPKLARQFDEPIVDSSMFPTYILSNLVKQHCTVALGGDGADELFGGYEHYSRLLRLKEISSKIPSYLRSFISLLADKCLPLGFKARNYLTSLDSFDIPDIPLIACYFNQSTRSKLLGSTDLLDIDSSDIRKSRLHLYPNLLERATRMDFENYLPEDILVKIDRASMMNSLELRAPFLDNNVVDFAFSRVPPSLKVSNSQRKIILKKLGTSLLPSQFNYQRKQGFSIPLSSWLQQGPFRDLFLDILFSSSCIFNRRTIEKLFASQDSGCNNGERLFALVQFELWRQSYNITL